MIKDALQKLADGSNLTEKEAQEGMLQIMQGTASEAQIAAYLMGLRIKGETVEEITGSVKAMREMAIRIHVSAPLVVDTCGTGGDRANTFNISTAAAFLVAGGGMTVAKHGNRSVSSKSGSADVLSALGVKIDLSPERVEACVNEVGIGFLFAPLYHGAMKHCAKPRADMGIRTLMNILGPLSNPAGATIQVLGVFDQALTEKLAQVLIRLGTQHCFVLHGKDGLDEITLTDFTYVSEGKAGRVSSYHISPKDFGLEKVSPKELTGGTPEQNARLIEDIFRGRRNAKREIVLVNAAPAFVASGKAKTLKEGYDRAAEVIDSGAAQEKLEKLVAFTNQGTA
ncbi:anthranilate phosphoribosyltransferase [Candidatus Nitronereus thalassa]|uniref:Anthranilate phosphoribosyltransferase n=1 Tax=Candidatus Nitronereus thalassa TaxID=3020898 RepID=A0ABU3K4J5_9BACT|nr:anthranilate phosphoribosyltransferase [Candidatus Nitronereus thalassa]MDT7041340.1 anthranilate phosphoribosyltransferase [Candidatus Nitronereus thalassa]